MIAAISNLRRWSDLIGTRSAFYRVFLQLGKRMGMAGPEKWHIRPRYVQYPVLARLRKSSDMAVFGQIYLQEEYKCLQDCPDVSVIVDLGANVGYSSVYFLNRFPHARVLALEPDAENFKICASNLEPYRDRYKAFCGAIWSHCTTLSVCRDQPEGDDWSCRVDERIDRLGNNAVSAWDLDTLLANAGLKTVDLLKIDIEGAEKQIFSGDTGWLLRVRNICIELHGADCEKAFFSALSNFDYELSHSGELTICRNLKRRGAV